MTKDLQIIKKLESRFGLSQYRLNRCGEFDLEIYGNKVIKLKLNSKIPSIKRCLTNKDLELIGELTNLEELDLSCSGITEIKGLNKLTGLKYLNLSDNQISTIQGLGKLTKLRELNLGNNNINAIQGLEKLNDLRKLSIFLNNIPKSQIDKFQANHPKINVFF